MNPASPELVALLAACRARPADDLPRLVLADWLDENGDPDRAEFVRVQVELSHPTADAKRTRELKEAERRLLAVNYRTWVGDLHELAQERFSPSVFQTPPNELIHPGYKFPLRYVRGLLRMDYWVTPDESTAPRVAAWLRSPHRHWLEQVGMSFGTPEEFVKADLPDELTGAIALTLTAFRQEGNAALVREQFRLLALSGNFAAVRSLWVYAASALPAVEELARSEVGRLVGLHLPVGAHDSRAGEAVRVAEVLASAEFTSLSSLDIGPLSEPALRAILRSPYLGNLTHLNLIGGRNGSPIGDAGMVALCGSKLAHTLRAVEFPNTGIGDAGAVALARSPLLAHMHGPRLNLMMNRIGDAGLTALAETEHLLRFSELVLRENQGGDDGVIALADSPYSANLRFLDFWRNRITDRGAFALARSPHLNSVVDLSVKENAVTAAGAAALHARFGEAAKV